MWRDLAQCALDRGAPFEYRRDLGGRDASTAPVRQPEIVLVERGWARVAARIVVRVRPDEVERYRQRIVNDDPAS